MITSPPVPKMSARRLLFPVTSEDKISRSSQHRQDPLCILHVELWDLQTVFVSQQEYILLSAVLRNSSQHTLVR